MTFQGDQEGIVSESGSAEDGLVSVRATSITALRGLSSTALRGLSLRARAPTLPEGCPRNFGSKTPNAMARGCVFRFLALLLIFRFIFRDFLVFCDKSALLYKLCIPNQDKVVSARTTERPRNSSAIYVV